MANASSPYDCDCESGDLCQWNSIAENNTLEFKLFSKGTKLTGPETDASGNVNGEWNYSAVNTKQNNLNFFYY